MTHGRANHWRGMGCFMLCVYRVKGSVVAEYSGSTPLSCSNYKWFWITWFNDLLTVGQGNTTGQNIIFNYQNPKPFNISYMSVSSGYVATTAYWVIPAAFYANGQENNHKSLKKIVKDLQSQQIVSPVLQLRQRIFFIFRQDYYIHIL